jgi:hypothetical protein
MYLKSVEYFVNYPSPHCFDYIEARRNSIQRDAGHLVLHQHGQRLTVSDCSIVPFFHNMEGREDDDGLGEGDGTSH